MAKGRPLPAWYFDEPHLDPADYFFLRAFGELNTCRSAGFGLGDIPWTAIVAYGDRAGLSPDMIDSLVIIIRQMDVPYRKWHDEEAEKRAKVPQKKIGNRTVHR